MSLKHYGIYLAYAPSVDLRAEGLGRHLAMLVKGAECLDGIHFTIVCPSWSVKSLKELFASEQVTPNLFTIVAPKGKPYILIAFELISTRQNYSRDLTWISNLKNIIIKVSNRIENRLVARVTAVSNPATFAVFLIEAVVIISVFLPFLAVAGISKLFFETKKTFEFLDIYLNNKIFHLWNAGRAKFFNVLKLPHHYNWVLNLYKELQKQETLRMQAKIDTLVNIKAWYCPTAFWPSFHDIKAPRVMCVPDVVLSEFPVGFSTLGGDHFLSNFENVELAIRNGSHYLTYSESVKWSTLVDRYAISASDVTVVPHAPSLLSQFIEISGFSDKETTSRNYCKFLLRNVFQRNKNYIYTKNFNNDEVKFIFYASQFRPNKNVFTLLRAFEFLLRKQYVGHKLFLTGNPDAMPEIWRFVVEHRLENDVIFLHGLTIEELAACYKLADLAVNPTLSEGGAPFTFTEALSVGTPIVMSRIPVVEEILTNPHLQELTLFDPFDWRDCAKRIEWAITHRDELLKAQLETYALLTQRTWTDVVAEHIRVMDDIALKAVVP